MDLSGDAIQSMLAHRIPDGVRVQVISTGERGWLYKFVPSEDGKTCRVEFTDGHDDYRPEELELIRF